MLNRVDSYGCIFNVGGLEDMYMQVTRYIFTNVVL